MKCTMVNCCSRPTPYIQAALALLVLTAAACSQPGEPVPELVARPAIETESDTAVLHVFDDRVTGSIVATYTNRTSTPVYLGRCGTSRHPGFVLDKENGGTWTLSYDPICDLIGTPPLEVRPCESRTDTLPVWSSRLPHVLPYFQSPEVTGTYRIVYRAYDCCSTPPGGAARHGKQLPREGHVSDAFRIEALK